MVGINVGYQCKTSQKTVDICLDTGAEKIFQLMSSIATLAIFNPSPVDQVLEPFWPLHPASNMRVTTEVLEYTVVSVVPARSCAGTLATFLLTPCNLFC